MPFIDSKVNVKVSKEQETEIKSRLGQAISLIPSKSESWLMVGIQDESIICTSVAKTANPRLL